jgi:hypothetical protein
MRSWAVSACACAVAAATMVPASAAAAATGSSESKTRYPVTSEPFVEPAGVVCPFALDVTFPYQRETETDYYNSSGQLTRSVVTGPLFAQYTNEATGATVERNSSGRGEFIYNADGSTTAIFDGHAGVGFHTTDNPAGKYLVFSGHAVVQIASSGHKDLTQLNGTAEDICQTLS